LLGGVWKGSEEKKDDLGETNSVGFGKEEEEGMTNDHPRRKLVCTLRGGEEKNMKIRKGMSNHRKSNGRPLKGSWGSTRN